MRILLLATIMIFASSASAGLYKWVDEEGNVHYSQKRPRDKQYKRIKAPKPAPTNASPLYQKEKKESNGSKTARTETANNKKIRADNCAGAKKNLQTYQLYKKISDGSGKSRTLKPSERKKRIQETQQAISEFCN